MSERSWYWSELAELTHKEQVDAFGWCSCEDGEKVFEDCLDSGWRL